MFMRMAAYSCRDYFSIAWNIIDFVIVVVSMLGYFDLLYIWNDRMQNVLMQIAQSYCDLKRV